VFKNLLLLLRDRRILFNSRSRASILEEREFFDQVFLLIDLVLEGSKPLDFALKLGRFGQVFSLKAMIVVGGGG
jgi:hypothetical protein